MIDLNYYLYIGIFLNGGGGEGPPEVTPATTIPKICEMQKTIKNV